METKPTVTTEPFPYYCAAGDHRADWEVPGDYVTHEHEWVRSPRTSAELVEAGYDVVPT